MANLTAPPDPRKADENYQQFVAWLRRDLQAYPEYQAVFARFRAEVLARARDELRAHPEADFAACRKTAILARLREAVARPLRGALANLLRDEKAALERLVERFTPAGADADLRHTFRVALFDLAAEPTLQERSVEEALQGLGVSARDQARRLRRKEAVPRHWAPLPNESLVPDRGATPPAPPDEPLIALLCTPLTRGEQAVLRAQYKLYRQDPAHKPSWGDVARVAGLKSAGSASRLHNR